MSSFDTKIQKLKGHHAHSAPEAKIQIVSWQHEYALLSVKKEWLMHPNTQQLKEACLKSIEQIESVLANDRTKTQDERNALFGEKDAHNVYLALLSQTPDDIDSEQKSIEDKVDFELEVSDEN